MNWLNNIYRKFVFVFTKVRAVKADDALAIFTITQQKLEKIGKVHDLIAKDIQEKRDVLKIARDEAEVEVEKAKKYAGKIASFFENE